MIKSGIKHCLEWGCARFGPHRRPPATPRLLILMYHRVLPVDDDRFRHEEPGMIVTPETFRMHLQEIRKFSTPIQLTEWTSACLSGKQLPPLSCAITFDDGWADNFEYGFPLLQEFDTPATIFLATDLIGTRQMFWPEKLSRLLDALGSMRHSSSVNEATAWLAGLLPGGSGFWSSKPGPEQLAVAINRAKSLPDQILGQKLSDTGDQLGVRLDPEQASLLDWQQVAMMLESGLIDIGSHTRGHIRLGSGTAAPVLESEIRGSKQVISTNTGHQARAFCFPNGDYSPQALQLVREQYQCAVSTESGWNSCATDPFRLQRIGIHNDGTSTPTAFQARISGWMR